jgi:hypothetical protein
MHVYYDATCRDILNPALELTDLSLLTSAVGYTVVTTNIFGKMGQILAIKS